MTDTAASLLARPLDSLFEAVAQRAAEIAAFEARPQRWFDVHDAAEYLRTSPDAIRAMVKRGRLEPARRKPKLLFSRDVLDAWVSHGA